MKAVQGMMEKMRLSAAEKKGIKVSAGATTVPGSSLPQAIGRVFAERLVSADGLAQTLGKIWCPIKGVACKDLGENHFLFTFMQGSGKRRALDEGPWMFGKDLVIMVDYEEEKTLEEITFAYTPIWVRVSKMPLGMMNKATGEAIGKEMGQFLSMDKEEDNTAVGQYLWIKVKIDIRKPLMRGVTLYVGKEEKSVWCPVVYEFLPDFCYTCGIIGHTDKACSQVLKEGEVQQYSKKLRYLPEKRRNEEGIQDRSGGGRFIPSWRSGNGGSRNQSWRTGSGRSGSDGPSWRKEDDKKDKEGQTTTNSDGEEVTSPIKAPAPAHKHATPRRSLILGDEVQKERNLQNSVGASSTPGGGR